jgi:hypothetical protein
LTTVRRVETDYQVRDLAQRLRSPRRAVPVVVVTVPAARDQPYIDAEQVADEVGDLAEVYLVPTGRLTWALSEGLPPMTGVSGGAGRAYPADPSWTDRPRTAPVRYAFEPAQGRTASRLLVSDALVMAHEAGLLGPRRDGAGTTVVTGEVGVLPSPGRAFVQVPAGSATVVQELTLPDVPLPSLLRPGMTVTGSYDPERGTLDVTGGLRDPAEALAEYGVGDVVLARVLSVADDSAVLQLHPSVSVSVDRADVTSNDLDLLTTLMTEGEVLLVRVTEPGPLWHVSLADIEDDEQPRTAPALLPGGPPWLLPPDVEGPVPGRLEAVPAPAEPETVQPEAADRVDTDDRAEPSTPAAPPVLRPTPLVLARQRRDLPSPVPQADGEAPASAAAVPAAPPPTTSRRSALASLERSLASARAEIKRLEADIDALRIERELLVSELKLAKHDTQEVRSQLARSRTDLRKSSRRSAGRAAEAEAFLDPEESFRYEVYATWVKRIPAAEKQARPLLDYSLGPDFLESLRRLQGITRGKVAAVVVEVLTGLARDQPGRELHQLRADGSGGSPTRVRPSDRAECWRVSLQVHSPSARRLHFWRLPDGSVELSRVAVHDDFRP